MKIKQRQRFFTLHLIFCASVLKLIKNEKWIMENKGSSDKTSSRADPRSPAE